MKRFVILFLLIISFSLIAQTTNEALLSSTNETAASNESYQINDELINTFKYGTTF